MSLYLASGLPIAILLAAAWFTAEDYSPADAIQRKRRVRLLDRRCASGGL